MRTQQVSCSHTREDPPTPADTVNTGAAMAALPLPRGWALRRARDEDADGLVALVGGVFEEYEGCVLDPDELDADLFAWASHLAESGGTGWVVTDDAGTIVSCVGVAPSHDPEAHDPEAHDPEADDGSTAELKRLYVAERARRRGIGAALVGLVEGWARDHGHVVVELWSDTRFDDAHRLYERLGYERSGAERKLHDPSDTTEWHFRRRLA